MSHIKNNGTDGAKACPPKVVKIEVEERSLRNEMTKSREAGIKDKRQKTKDKS
jgi:hypothetical protein